MVLGEAGGVFRLRFWPLALALWPLVFALLMTASDETSKTRVKGQRQRPKAKNKGGPL
jgi:hypothetical protein